MTHAARTPAWRVLVFSQALALALLGACAAWAWRAINYVLRDHLITGSFGLDDALHSRLGWQLGAFAASLWLCHALLGLAAYGLGRMTCVAYPRIRSPYLLTAGWFIALAGLALAANATMFPASMFTGPESWWRVDRGSAPPVAWLAAGLAALLIVVAVRALAQRRWRWTLAGTGSVIDVGVAAMLIWMPRIPAFAAHAESPAPNIVILGLDSFRNDLTVPRRGPMDAPNIRDFIAKARRFDDATTPLAR